MMSAPNANVGQHCSFNNGRLSWAALLGQELAASHASVPSVREYH
jgi:hypothetical protein